VDTAANTGAGQPIAHASVDLDMRQWKDSQTYQAEVPLANDQVKSSVSKHHHDQRQWLLLAGLLSKK